MLSDCMEVRNTVFVVLRVVTVIVAAVVAVMLSGFVLSCGRGDSTSGSGADLAERRVLRAQALRNLSPDDDIVPELTLIVDSMARDGRDVCYFAALNVLIDQLFSESRFAEADTLAVRMQHEAEAEDNRLARAIAHRVRGQMLYKLSQPDRALTEFGAARSLIPDSSSGLKEFSTLASIDEWRWIAARAVGDSAMMRRAAQGYAAAVHREMSRGWRDSTAHFPVTALAFDAAVALADHNLNESGRLLSEAGGQRLPYLPARAYEHYYAVLANSRAAAGDYDSAIAALDTLLLAHRDFPWFYLVDLREKAHLLSDAGRHRESAAASARYVAMHDSLMSAQTDRRLQDLTVLYRSEIDREQRRADNFMKWGLGGVSLLLLVLLVVSYRSARSERKKNRLLVERLREADQLNVVSQPQSAPEEPESDMDRLDRYMMTVRPYTDPALSRRELAAYLGVTPDEVARIIRRERDMSVLAYINSCRLDEARRVLESDSAEAVGALAERLGFGTARTLQRAFRDHFDMSPTQYRNLAHAVKGSD